MVADVDSYYRFIPFVSSSRVIEHTGPRSSETSLEDRPWLDDSGKPGEVHKLDHIMQIAIMGFDQSWKSYVTCEKYNVVSVSEPCIILLLLSGADDSIEAYASSSTLFKTLSTTWTFTPSPTDVPHLSNSQSLPHASAPLSSPGQSQSDQSTPAGQSAKDGNADSPSTTPTLVSIDLAYEFANPLYAAAASGSIEKVSAKIMDAFEKRVREVYGDGVK